MTTIALADFLLARFTEDEEVARAVPAGGGEWEAGDRCVWRTSALASVDIITDGSRGEGGCESPEIAEHVARYDPARVLIESAVKRQIVENHALNDVDPCTSQDHMGYLLPANDCPVFRALAAVYADHPDFRAEWRVVTWW